MSKSDPGMVYLSAKPAFLFYCCSIHFFNTQDIDILHIQVSNQKNKIKESIQLDM